MFISKYKVDKTEEHLKMLSNPELGHKFTWEFFKGVIDFAITRENLGILYKFIVPKDNQLYLIIQSKMKPNYVPKGVEQIYSVDDTAMLRKLQNFETVSFQVYVNPVQFKKEYNKRICVRGAKNRVNWFKEYIEKNGCEVISVEEKDFSILKCEKNTGDFSISVSNMMGRLKISDFEKFKCIVENGIGREKAYGLGLITFGT